MSSKHTISIPARQIVEALCRTRPRRKQATRESLKGLEEDMDEVFADTHKRFDAIDRRFDRIDNRLDRMDTKLDRLQ